MIAKLMDNQLTLPDTVLDALGRPTHVKIVVEGDRVVVSAPRGFDEEMLEELQRDLEARGITEAIIPEAIAWARRQG